MGADTNLRIFWNAINANIEQSHVNGIVPSPFYLFVPFSDLICMNADERSRFLDAFIRVCKNELQRYNRSGTRVCVREKTDKDNIALARAFVFVRRQMIFFGH